MSLLGFGESASAGLLSIALIAFTTGLYMSESHVTTAESFELLHQVVGAKRWYSGSGTCKSQ